MFHSMHIHPDKSQSNHHNRLTSARAAASVGQAARAPQVCLHKKQQRDKPKHTQARPQNNPARCNCPAPLLEKTRPSKTRLNELSN